MVHDSMHHCKFALAVYSQTALQKTRKKDTKERSPPGWHDPLAVGRCHGGGPHHAWRCTVGEAGGVL